MKSKICRLLILVLLSFSFVSCASEVPQALQEQTLQEQTLQEQTPQEQTPQEQVETEYVTILAVYRNDRHDGRTDKITVLSNGTFLWAVYLNGELNHELAFDNAEDLFDHAIQYKSNWDHNKWIKE